MGTKEATTTCCSLTDEVDACSSPTLNMSLRYWLFQIRVGYHFQPRVYEFESPKRNVRVFGVSKSKVYGKQSFYSNIGVRFTYTLPFLYYTSKIILGCYCSIFHTIAMNWPYELVGPNQPVIQLTKKACMYGQSNNRLIGTLCVESLLLSSKYFLLIPTFPT